MFANLTWGNYDYQAYCYRQSVPFTAEDEAADAWGAMRGILRKDATSAVIALLSSGGSPGISLPAGTIINRSDGLSYVTQSAVQTDASGNVSCNVVCSQSGTAGNCSIGTGFTLANAITGINAAFTATASVTLGVDQEDDAEFRERYLAAYGSRDGGGRSVDYVEWAEAVPGVTRAWCNPMGFGAGTVVVYPMLDDVRSATSGFPQGTNGSGNGETRYPNATGDQLVVANAIQALRPVTSLVIVCAPVPQAIDIVIGDLPAGTLSASIQAALADLYLRIGTPLGMTLSPASIESAILSTGAATFTLVSPVTPVAIPIGSLPVVGGLAVQ